MSSNQAVFKLAETQVGEENGLLFFANLKIRRASHAVKNEQKSYYAKEIYILGNKGYANSGFVKYRPAIWWDDYFF